jgi:acetylornithine deacetylase/succinyl-diaminopimelate desuccinylase-like protein
MAPAFETMGFEHVTLDNPVSGRGPVLVASRIEDPSLPTVLLYGHGDVVRSVASEWENGRDPYVTSREGDRLYGRGVVDNKGQHTLAMLALEAVLTERGKLGFNAKFMIKTGEEQGSPGLEKLLIEHTNLFTADAFLGFDGPRKSFSRLDLNLGCRGGVFFNLVVDLNR